MTDISWQAYYSVATSKSAYQQIGPETGGMCAFFIAAVHFGRVTPFQLLRVAQGCAYH